MIRRYAWRGSIEGTRRPIIKIGSHICQTRGGRSCIFRDSFSQILRTDIAPPTTRSRIFEGASTAPVTSNVRRLSGLEASGREL